MSTPEASSPDTSPEFPGPARLLRRYGLRAKKSLGQNFLVDLNLARKIVSLADLPPEGVVVELGVGLGTLTLALAEKARRVIGYELDETLLEILKNEGFLPENVELRHGDILSLDYRALAQELGQRLLLFGNLPYYLSSRLLYKLFEEREAVEQAVFMFQKEVAERLTASPGSKTYGPLSVLLSLAADVDWLLTLSPAHFHPRPEVSSAVLKIRFHPEPLPHEETLKRLLKAAFANRRKKLAKNLQALGLSKKEAEEMLAEVGLKPEVRAEEVPPKTFLELAARISSKKGSSPIKCK